jgi:hypothetical protein
MMTTFIQRVAQKRAQTAEFLIAMIDSYRLLERYATVWEQNRLVDNINRMINRYDRLTRIERRLHIER